MSQAVKIRYGDPVEDGARALLEASHALMQSLFPAESNHYLSLDDLKADNIRFFVADLHGQAAGCGALALREGYGEVKSMFVDPAKRGAKLGQRILDRIEEEARENGLTLLRLETGNTLAAAHRLYKSQGYALCGPFGDYKPDPNSLFMEKTL